MSTIMRPVGPQPARVYWMRRLVVVGVPVLAILFVWWLLSGSPQPPAEAETPQAVATETNTPTCGVAELVLTVTTDARRYAAGELPVFTIGIENRGDQDCVVDAGEAEVYIRSGSDRIFSSLDCVGEAAERLLLLPAGGQADETQFTWQRERSAPDCGDGPEPRPGTYRVSVRLAGDESPEAVFELAG